MRKMATVRRIDNINPIPDADAIEVAAVGGWKVVVKKGEFQVGDLAIYFEIDSWITTGVAPFLIKPGHYPKTFEGVEGERLRTVRLRGQISQGLLLPYAILPFGSQGVLSEGDDVSELLGIKKWEAPIPAQLAGEIRGMFPSFIRKTDQERIQNLTTEFPEWLGDVDDPVSQLRWEITEKLDGCLFEGTMISVPHGSKSIESINTGDIVISFNHDSACEEESIVTGVLHREVTSEWIEIEMDNGEILTVTPNHPVFLPNLGCYRRADQLNIGDNLTKKV